MRINVNKQPLAFSFPNLDWRGKLGGKRASARHTALVNMNKQPEKPCENRTKPQQMAPQPGQGQP
jgi:hypothetical protein